MATVDNKKLEDLLERAQQHDEKAMAELLEAYSQRLLESVRHELGDRLRQRLESQDVMQQVYLDALRSIKMFENRGGDSFYHWLKRIAVNRICDVDRGMFKTQKRGGEVRTADLPAVESLGAKDASMMNLLDAVAGSVTSPSLAAGTAEQVNRLQQAIDKLSPDHREVITLRYLRQLNVAETAAKMDRSERAVRSLCVRALIHLRELLGDAV